MKNLLLLLSIMLLGACAKEIVYVDRYTVTYVGMDEAWLTACPIVQPPDKKLYDLATDVQKRDMWVKTFIDQAEATHAKNLVLDEARKYNRSKVIAPITTCDGGPCQ